jgi:hypothetical protein
MVFIYDNLIGKNKIRKLFVSNLGLTHLIYTNFNEHCALNLQLYTVDCLMLLVSQFNCVSPI